MDRVDPLALAYMAARPGPPIVAAIPARSGPGRRVAPQVTRFEHPDGQVTELFHIKPVYYQTWDGAWRPLAEVADYHGNRDVVLDPRAVGRIAPRFLHWLDERCARLGGRLSIGGDVAVQLEHMAWALSASFYPEPDGSPVASFDVDYFQGNFSWSGNHSTANADLYNNVTTMLGVGSLSTTSISRSVLLFDTSTLSGATVSAATLSVMPHLSTNADNDGDNWVNVVGPVTTVSNTTPNLGDYSHCGATTDPTEGSTRIGIGAFTLETYADYVLNSTARGWMNLSGTSKFGLREGHDCIDSPPVDQTAIRFWSADVSGTGNDPVLSIAYTVPTTYNVDSRVAVSPAPNVSKGLAVAARVAVSPAPNVAKGLGKTQTVSVAPGPTATRTPGRDCRVAVAPAPTLQKTTSKTPVVAVTPGPTARRDIAKSIAVAVAPAPYARKGLAVASRVSVAPLPNIAKALAKLFAVAVTPAPRASRGALFALNSRVAVVPAPNAARQTIKTLIAAVAPAPNATRGVTKDIRVAVAPAPAMTKGLGKTSRVAVTPAPHITKALGKTSRVAVTPIGRALVVVRRRLRGIFPMG